MLLGSGFWQPDGTNFSSQNFTHVWNACHSLLTELMIILHLMFIIRSEMLLDTILIGHFSLIQKSFFAPMDSAQDRVAAMTWRNFYFARAVLVFNTCQNPLFVRRGVDHSDISWTLDIFCFLCSSFTECSLFREYTPLTPSNLL